MSLQTTITQVLLEVGIATISELAKNLVYFILIFWGIKKISREMPKWIESYNRTQLEKYRIEQAIAGRKRL